MKRSSVFTSTGHRRLLLTLMAAMAAVVTAMGLAAGATAGAAPTGAAPAAPAGSWKLLPAAPVTKLPTIINSAWTGNEMVIHGVRYSSGGIRRVTFGYRPATNTWVALARGPKPLSGLEATDVSVWTGSELLVTGLTNGGYNPATNTWRPIPRGEGPNEGAVVAWTGHEELVWGGNCCAAISNNGMAYDPAAGTWSTLPTAPLKPRRNAEGAWTGTELVVAGGSAWAGYPRSVGLKDGAAYNPVTGQWRPIPPMPRREAGAVAVWDGTEILFLGGHRPGANGPPGQGLAFNPATSTWRKLPRMAYPRTGFAAVWTGHQLLVWGGLTGTYTDPVLPPHGEAYNPATNRWTALPASPLHGRVVGTAAWTGHSMIVWGGWAPHGKTTTPYTDGAIYTPRTP